MTDTLQTIIAELRADSPDKLHQARVLHGFADRLEAIASASATHPGYWAAVDDAGWIAFGTSVDDADGGETARTEVNADINKHVNEYGDDPLHLVRLYTAPPSAAVVPDIAAAVLAERNACSDLCNDMADWPLAKIPSANPEGGSDYGLGVMRGLVTAANAIRRRTGATP